MNRLSLAATLLAAYMIKTTDAQAGIWWLDQQPISEYNNRGFITFQTPIKKGDLNCHEYDVKGRNMEISYDFYWTIRNYPIQYYITQLAQECVKSNRTGQLIHYATNDVPHVKTPADVNFERCYTRARKGPNDRANVNCRNAIRGFKGYLENACYEPWRNYSWETYHTEVSNACKSHPEYIARVQDQQHDDNLADFTKECKQEPLCVDLYRDMISLYDHAPLQSFKDVTTLLNQQRIDRENKNQSHLIEEGYNLVNIRTWLANIELGKSKFNELASKNSLTLNEALAHIAGQKSEIFRTDFDGSINDYKKYLGILENLYKRVIKKINGSFTINGRFRTFQNPVLQNATIDWSDLRETNAILAKDYTRDSASTFITINKPDTAARFNYKIDLKEAAPPQPASRAHYQAISSCEELNRKLPRDIPSLDCGALKN